MHCFRHWEMDGKCSTKWFIQKGPILWNKLYVSKYCVSVSIRVLITFTIYIPPCSLISRGQIKRNRGGRRKCTKFSLDIFRLLLSRLSIFLQQDLSCWKFAKVSPLYLDNLQVLSRKLSEFARTIIAKHTTPSLL